VAIFWARLSSPKRGVFILLQIVWQIKKEKKEGETEETKERERQKKKKRKKIEGLMRRNVKRF